MPREHAQLVEAILKAVWGLAVAVPFALLLYGAGRSGLRTLRSRVQAEIRRNR